MNIFHPVSITRLFTFFAVPLVLGLATSTAHAMDLGDVDADNQITTKDVYLIRHYTEGSVSFSVDQKIAADVDKNGAVNDADIRLVKLKRDGLIALPAKHGDINLNMALQSNDTTLMRRMVGGVGTFTPGQRKLADVDLDGDVDEGSKADNDVVFLRQTIGQIRTLPVYLPAELRVEVEYLNQNSTAVAGQKDVTLFAFETHAVVEDTAITAVAFTAAQGNLVHASNYTLWVDADDDGTVESVLQSAVNSMNDSLIFDNLSNGKYVIPARKHVRFEVHGDIASSFLSPATLQLQFANASGIDYIQAETGGAGEPLVGVQKNGACTLSACDTIAITTPSTVWHLVGQGNLFVSKATTPLRSRQLLGGSIGDAILALNFSAENNDIAVTNIRLTLEGNIRSLDRVELWKAGANTPFSIVSVGGCGNDTVPQNTLCAQLLSQELVVPKNTSMNIYAIPKMKPDSLGATAGDTLRLRLQPTLNGGAAGIEAIDSTSSNFLQQNNGDTQATGEIFIGMTTAGPNFTIEGKTNVVVLSKIASIVNANPDADGTAIPTGYNQNIGQFKFSTFQNANTYNGLNKFALNDIVFTVHLNHVVVNENGYKLSNKADSSVQASCTLDPSSTTTTHFVVCDNLSMSEISTNIASATSATFVLSGDILSVGISIDEPTSLYVSLDNFSNSDQSTFGPSKSHIRWIDSDNGSQKEFLWIDSPESIVKSTQYQN